MENEKEREFIHALASPLAGVEMILELFVFYLKAVASEKIGFGERLTDVMAGIERMKTLLKDRRKEVLSDK
jgi:hypothetical protein